MRANQQSSILVCAGPGRLRLQERADQSVVSTMSNWVILSWLACDARHWEGFAEQLSRSQNKASVLAGFSWQWESLPASEFKARSAPWLTSVSNKPSEAGFSSPVTCIGCFAGYQCAHSTGHTRYPGRFCNDWSPLIPAWRVSRFYRRLRSRNLKHELALPRRASRIPPGNKLF